MRNVSIDRLDHLPQAVVPIGTDYPYGRLLDWHSHRRAQLLFGATGTMQVTTADGDWMVPPQRAVWIPADMPHRVRMLGVTTCSLYIEPAVRGRAATRCEVIAISPLLRQLLIAAVDIEAGYDPQGRDGALMALTLHEIRRAAVLPLYLPLPSAPALRARCQEFLREPDIHRSAATWAQSLRWSTRTFRRRFHAQTGLGFIAWRQQACVLLSLPRLAAGDSVTRIALDLGYDNAGAFSTMFRRQLGVAPSAYRTVG